MHIVRFLIVHIQVIYLDENRYYWGNFPVFCGGVFILQIISTFNLCLFQCNKFRPPTWKELTKGASSPYSNSKVLIFSLKNPYFSDYLKIYFFALFYKNKSYWVSLIKSFTYSSDPTSYFKYLDLSLLTPLCNINIDQLSQPPKSVFLYISKFPGINI